MKALTVCQPYAHLISLGLKRVENRRWPTHYRGPLAIHAGKSQQWRDRDLECRHGIRSEDMAFGAVIATTDLLACIELRGWRSHWHLPLGFEWVRDHEHAHGPWAWVLGPVVRLDEPVPVRGQQGLWDWEEAEDADD